MYFINVWTEPTTQKKGPKRAQKKHRADPQGMGEGLCFVPKKKSVCVWVRTQTQRGALRGLTGLLLTRHAARSRIKPPSTLPVLSPLPLVYNYNYNFKIIIRRKHFLFFFWLLSRVFFWKKAVAVE